MISVIIPVYNREKYIEECIRSVQNSTYKNYEIILIEDGSTDNTLSICRALAKEDGAIRILEGTHAGVSAARNKGLEDVKGDYVFFLDSDDIIHPQLLETLVTGMRTTGAAIAGTRTVPIPDKYWSTIYSYIEKDTGPGETTFQTFEETMKVVFEQQTPLGMIGGVMMRWDLIGDTRFREELYIGEDFFFIYENMIKGGSTLFLKQCWYYARHHAENTSWDFAYTGFMNRLLRRKMVWESEEALGRKRNVSIQKNTVLGVYRTCRNSKNLSREDLKKINKVMRAYGKVLLPDLMVDGKLRYILYFWIPGGFWLDKKVWPILKKTVQKLRGKK